MRNCVFCGTRPADSNEHAWPAWLLSLLRRGVPSIHAERDGEPDREWRGIKASVKVKRVCHVCNNGWMSELENQARPLLLPLVHGQAVTLDGPERLTLATWSIKTAMVFDCTRADDKMYFSQADRDYLFNACGRGGLGSPFPPHTFVWLATYQGDVAASCAASVLVGVGDAGTPAKQVTIEAHVATISAGSFVTQVLVGRFPPEVSTLEPVLHEGAGSWARATIQIWPPHGTRVSLPPEVPLDDETTSLDAFALRWPSVSTRVRRSTAP